MRRGCRSASSSGSCSLGPSRPGPLGGVIAASAHISLGRVALALALVAVAAAVSLWRQTELEGDLAVAVIRSFVQLTAIGYVIQAIFDSDSLWLVALLLAVMGALWSFPPWQRRPAVPGGLRATLLGH